MIKVIKEYLKVLSENPGIIKKNDQEMPGFDLEYNNNLLKLK